MGEQDDDEIRLDWDPIADFVRDVEVRNPESPYAVFHTDTADSTPQRLFPSTFLLFYCPDGGSVIGGVWNPAAENPKQFKAGLGVPVAPVLAGGESKPKVALDKQAVLAQIERFGKGLVRKVELR
jgi:U3 small nucleolar RNA-associated protein 22